MQILDDSMRYGMQIFDDSNVVQLPSDAAHAAQARSEVGPIMQALADALNKYKALGLVISASCGQDAYGRATAGVVNVVKPL